MLCEYFCGKLPEAIGLLKTAALPTSGYSWVLVPSGELTEGSS